LRTLGLAAALMSPMLAQGAVARTAWTIDGPVTLPEMSAPATAPQNGPVNPAQNFLEESGATGGEGQHS
jgi:hypothetical protein